MRLRHSSEPAERVTTPSAVHPDVARERGPCLEAARREDRVWREKRQARTQKTLARTEFASASVMAGIRRVATGLCALVLGGTLLIVGCGALGFNSVPDAVMILLAIGLCGLVICGLLALIGWVAGYGVNRGLRSWAFSQSIDLRSPVSEPQEGSKVNEQNSAARLGRVKEILFSEWDPIGVNGYPQCRDEYDSYAPGICRLLEEGADENRLTLHLLHITHETIGLTALPESHHRAIARRLLEL